jgi:surfeit locus 1 family protein
MSPRARFRVVTLAALVAAGVTARLGLWQLDRAAQKEAIERALEERVALPPLPSAELARDEAAAGAQHHRRIELEGRWQPGATVFLDNRPLGGRPGFIVVTPLLLAAQAGAGSGPEAAPEAVLVQRGWLARDPLDRTRLPPVPTPPGVVRVVGRVAPPPSRLFEFEGEASAGAGPIRQNLDVRAHAAETGLSLRPLSIVETGPPAAPDGLAREWPAVATGVYKHHGYAFQWFALAALIAGLYVWFQLLRPRFRPRARSG